MSAHSKNFWLAVSTLVVAVLLFIWLAAGLLTVVVFAAASDLVLSAAADRRNRLNETRAKVSDQ